MNHARFATSARLKRVHKVLADGRWHSTWEIMTRGKVCAVSAVIAELRANGARIECEQRIGNEGQRVWYYRMTKGPRQDG
jgi:hypothetical protein